MANLTPESVVTYNLSDTFLAWLNGKVLSRRPYRVQEGFVITHPKHPELKHRASMFLRFDAKHKLSDDIVTDIAFDIMAYSGVADDDLAMDSVTLSVDEDLDGRTVIQIGVPTDLAIRHFGVPKEYQIPN